jgi:hypothetical protein
VQFEMITYKRKMSSLLTKEQERKLTPRKMSFLRKAANKQEKTQDIIRIVSQYQHYLQEAQADNYCCPRQRSKGRPGQESDCLTMSNKTCFKQNLGKIGKGDEY